MVKSDAAPEIMSAVYDLGWHSEPSLPGKWPHNTEHERWGQSVKSVCRANMLQSGLPTKVVPWCMMYSAIALAADQPCPIHAHERDAAGNVLPEYAYKENRTCWQEHWDGVDFPGLNGLFGQLCYYRDPTTHSMMPNSSLDCS